MIEQRTAFLAALLACLLPVSGSCGQLGEPAPALTVKEWLKGNPVEIKPGTNVYLIEIWTSWTAASRASITNLNELQNRFRDKGVVVAAISDEPVDKLKDFLLHAGTNIEYAVATDNLGQTARGFMLPLYLHGVPHTFVVGTNGALLWHGPPTPALNHALNQIVSGHYDLEAAKKADIARHQMEQYLTLAQRGDRRTAQAGRSLLAARTNNVTQLCELAFQIATSPRIPKRDLALATEALDQAEKLGSTNVIRVALTRAVLVFESGKHEEGLRQAKAALAASETPRDKQEAQDCVRTMEARLARQAAAKRKVAAASNAPPSVAATNRNEGLTNVSPAQPQGAVQH